MTSEITPFSNPPAPIGTWRLNSKWKRILFFFHKRVFLSRLEGHLDRRGRPTKATRCRRGELPVPRCEAPLVQDELCEQFAQRWGLDLDLSEGGTILPAGQEVWRGCLYHSPMKDSTSDLHASP